MSLIEDVEEEEEDETKEKTKPHIADDVKKKPPRLGYTDKPKW